MAKERLVSIREAELTNNCPECFNQDMLLTFFQKHLYNRFYHRVTAEVSYQIKCRKCESVIYPVKWTEDIERIFEYFQKMVEPKPRSLKFTKFFYILILVLALLAVTGAYAYYSGLIAV